MFKSMLKTFKNSTIFFNNIIWIIYMNHHIHLSNNPQNKLTIVFKTVVNSFLGGY